MQYNLKEANDETNLNNINLNPKKIHLFHYNHILNTIKDNNSA